MTVISEVPDNLICFKDIVEAAKQPISTVRKALITNSVNPVAKLERPLAGRQPFLYPRDAALALFIKAA